MDDLEQQIWKELKLTMDEWIELCKRQEFNDQGNPRPEGW